MIINIYGASFSAFIIAGQRNAREKLLGIILHLCEKIVKAWLNTK